MFIVVIVWNRIKVPKKYSHKYCFVDLIVFVWMHFYNWNYTYQLWRDFISLKLEQINYIVLNNVLNDGGLKIYEYTYNKILIYK